MKFFCGFFPTNRSQSEHPVPLRNRQIWGEPYPVYLCGSWSEQDFFVYDQYDTKILVIGDFYEKEKRTQSLLADVCTKVIRDYTALTRLPGNYNLIIQDQQNSFRTWPPSDPFIMP